MRFYKKRVVDTYYYYYVLTSDAEQLALENASAADPSSSASGTG